MELIERLQTRKDTHGNIKSYGIFLCPFCLQKVVRPVSNGYKCKSCGCQEYSEEKNKKISEAQKGKKLTEEHRNKINKFKKGKDHYLFGKYRSEDSKQKQSETRKGIEFGEEWRQKISKATKGENNPMFGVHRFGELSPTWDGGKSFEPYSPEFNKPLKQSILERDNYTCQYPDCNHSSERLIVHHIDYNKKNSNPENLIILCNSCHSKTNGKNNRQYWTEFYQILISSILF